MLSLDEGITIEIDNAKVGLAIGDYKGRMVDAPLYVIGSSIGYKEYLYNG
jgi:hypothetical protein